MWAYNYTNPTELYHHGVLGMKWGKRRANPRDATGYSSRQLKKKFKKMEKGSHENIDKEGARIHKQLEKTKEYKDAKTASDNLLQLNSAFKKEHPNGTLVFDKSFADQYNSTVKKSQDKAKELFEKNKDSLAKATLKDMGFDDTQAGREYVKKVLMQDF